MSCIAHSRNGSVVFDPSQPQIRHIKEKKMDVSLILKVAGIGMLVTVAAQILGKAGRDEQAMLVSVAGIIIVLLMLVQEIGNLIGEVRSVFGF